MTFTRTLIAAGIIAAGCHGAMAQEIKLRVADLFPIGHYLSENATKVWMKTATEAAGGKVKFEHYPAEQLGKAKDMLSLTQTGVVDVGYVAPSFVSDKLPLSVVSELPELFSTSCQGTLAYWSLVKEGGLLDKLEYEPAGIRAMFTFVLPPYQIYMGKDPITGTASFENRKIRTTGGAKEIAVRKLNAAPVLIPTPDVREAIARGTIDGMLFPHSSIPPYDITRHVKFATVGENFGSFAGIYFMSRKKWMELPADVRGVLDKAGNDVVASNCKRVDEIESEDIAKMKGQGVTFVKLPAAEHDKLAKLMATVGGEWADALDKRGKKGAEVPKAFQSALKP